MGQQEDGTRGRLRLIPVRMRSAFLFVIVLIGTFLIFTINNGSNIHLFNNEVISTSWYSRLYRETEVVDSDESFTIKTEGCTIPGLQPFDESIRKFIEHPKHIKECPYSNYPLLDNNDTHIWVISENLKHFRSQENVDIVCCYKSFVRPTAVVDVASADVDNRVLYKTCLYFSNSIEVMNEFVKVTCRYIDKIVYEQYFLFAIKKPMLAFKEDATEVPQNQSYNVIVLGMDAISRLNFYRTMPKTLAYLKRKGAIELLGYNKVGDNTFPNLTPMLLGIRDTDLKKTCWPNMKATFDNCPFVWEWFKDAGYYTALGEDSASLGTFNFEKYGFIGTPTDYYLHTFMYEAEINVGSNKDFNSFLCMGNKYFYKVLLDYIESLIMTIKPFKLFGFFWEVTMSHDYLNYPMAMDESYENFLKRLDYSNALDETIIILLSDHGIRWGDIRFTKQGRLEERLPLMQILLPPSFRENFGLAYYNLRMNSKRLTTPFDIYATLTDLINLKTIKNENIVSRSETSYANDISISLFLPIPKNRTCKMAGIFDHWCTCHTGSKIPKDSSDALEAAKNLVIHLNLFIRSHKKCAQLTLAKVVEVTEMLAGTPEEKEVGWQEFLVVVQTKPGGGVFEATMRRNYKKWTLSGTISRLNLYGNQSHCVHHYQLKLYCFCL